MTLQEHTTLPSTNSYCELLDLDKVEEFTVIWAHEQTDGIGQRGNHWVCEKNKNLTFSLILKPTFLPSADQFMLTKTLSLGVCDMLTQALPSHKVHIKWPNDIYVDGNKICGILTSNKVLNNRLSVAICGIGINVNQLQFPEWVPNPTSFSLLTRQAHELRPLLNNVVAKIAERYRQLERHEWTTIDHDYLKCLLHYRTVARYKYHGEDIEATITGVNRFGHLQLALQNGEKISCDMKEIALL